MDPLQDLTLADYRPPDMRPLANHETNAPPTGVSYVPDTDITL